ncbi:Acyl-CoA dehydrogenase type 2 domain protein [Beutenbergia cavernae DSM 12333]|uniref:Acyl-CoA dehydrogenase type 2 domain protein n=1 Tax=Beutenbergia cavernae (strain ATCC BAA-8 / DSM 12333 / CCUG 43141 / JCM 11478 / NBRC 16432 / NCIMB 13614 / HKI 0122) TaxID=471853 RepID=C5BY98_BEUC1|nr:acyl-CoA dehydrogenase family protein [Beutenbergia cavernae]ACQ80998.1 Acyl-CoA dehydrogenase type 2 domain protein [Beutenbergia cavernae DSM 12333]
MLLPDDLLTRIHDRAAGYDAANAFCTEDLEELAAVGYLRAAVPADLGGLGLSLLELTREQTRLAAAAPATALAVNMHHVWTVTARIMRTRGDHALDWLLAEAAAGEVFAFGNSEAGNDLVLFGSRTQAVPDGAGGYRFTGTKIFTSLSPAWTRLGVLGRDDDSADAPKLVHAFLRREDGGTTAADDWDTLGMRATQSSTTRLEGAHASADRVVRRLDPGPQADPLIFGIFAAFEILLASVYAGIGARALELAAEAAHRRTSMKNDGRPYSADPDIRRRVAAAAIVQDALAPQIEALARDVDDLVDHGDQWFRLLAGLKVRVTEAARVVVDEAIRVAGGGSYFNGSELSRLYRDVLAGMFHPSDDESAHGTVANAVLGPVPES